MAEASWDTSKENFAPARTGRSVRALLLQQTAPLTPAKSVGSDIEEDRRRLLLDIGNSQDDPLPAWLRYVKWTHEAFPAAGGKDQLFKALEAATKALAGCERYYDDPRFLRLWIQYADCLPDPSDVFVFLQDRGIGRDLALLYEAYATFLELKGAFPRADLVYQEGINRMAKPLDRLKQKHVAFQQRMAKRLQRQAQEQALGMAPCEDDAAARSALRDLHSAVPGDGSSSWDMDENGRQRSRRHQHRSATQQHASVTGVRGQPARPLASAASAASLLSGRGAPGALAPVPCTHGAGSADAGGNTGFEVCIDDEFQAGRSGPALAAFPPRMQHTQDLPGFAAVRKENAADPGVWTSARLKQDRSLVPPAPTAKLEICMDDEFREQEEAEEAALAAAAAAAAQARLQQQQQALTGARSGIFGAQAGVGRLEKSFALAPLSAADTAVACLPPPVIPPAEPAPIPAPRAAAAVLAANGASTSNRGRGSGSSSSTVVSSISGGTGGGYLEQLLVGPDGKEQCFEEARASAWFVHSKNKKQVQVQQQQQHQFEEHHQGGEEQKGQQEQQQQEQQHFQAPEPTVTISTRAALNAVNAMFGADLTASAAPPPCIAAVPDAHLLGRRSLAGGGAGDPTITMSTRAALASIDRMFSSDLTTSVAPSPLVARGGVRMSTAATGRLGMEGGVGAEPTMTFNTRDAFRLVNGLFCDEAPGPLAGDLTQRVSRGRPSGAPGLGLGMYEDTEFITRGDIAAAAARQRPGRRSSVAPVGGLGLGLGLGLYQDTEFITRPMGEGSGSGTTGGGGALALYEDTEFITRPMAGDPSSTAAGSGGLGVYEDTEFMPRTSSGAAGKGSGGGSDAGGLGLYQDTEFITTRVAARGQQLQQKQEQLLRGPLSAQPPNAASAGGDCDPDSTQGLIRCKENHLPANAGAACSNAQKPIPLAGRHPDEAAAALGGGLASTDPPVHPASGLFAERHDGFEVMDSPQALRERLAARAAGRGGDGSVPTSAPPSPDKEGPKENAPPRPQCAAPGACALPPRSLDDPRARAAVLQPLSMERAALLGVEIDEQHRGEEEQEQDGIGRSGEPQAAPDAAAASLASPSRRALFRD